MIRVTVTVDLLDDFWGAEACFEDAGLEGVKELIAEDPGEFLWGSPAEWKIEKV